MAKHKLKGIILNREVYLDGVYLSPKRSQKVYNHSPDGFNWGYGGSGPAQLALAVCLELMGKDEAMRKYQDFKRTVIAGLPQGQDFEIEFDIDESVRDTLAQQYYGKDYSKLRKADRKRIDTQMQAVSQGEEQAPQVTEEAST